jgi:RimJ/RimL family protein N-acetyltransferase
MEYATMFNMSIILFETERLLVRLADEGDLNLFDELWHCTSVMWNVGFPNGLPMTRDAIGALLKKQGNDDEVFGKRLVIEFLETGTKIGEAKLGKPDEDGISEPDVKLLPAFWGQGYGREVMGAILSYTFENSETKIVQTTPRVTNVGSHRMVEAYGGVRVAEEQVFEVPDGKEGVMQEVPYYTYHVRREDFLK